MGVRAAPRPEVLLEAAPLAARELLEDLALLGGHDRLDLFQPALVAAAQPVLRERRSGEPNERQRGDDRHRQARTGPEKTGDLRFFRHDAS